MAMAEGCGPVESAIDIEFESFHRVAKRVGDVEESPRRIDRDAAWGGADIHRRAELAQYTAARDTEGANRIRAVVRNIKTIAEGIDGDSARSVPGGEGRSRSRRQCAANGIDREDGDAVRSVIGDEENVA